MKRVVVTGMGMVNALGLDKETSFKNICDGKTGVKKITLFDATDFPVQIAAQIDDFDPATVMEAKEIKKADRFIHLGLKAANEAINDANLSEFDPNEFGVSSAAGIGGLPNIEKNSNICFEKGPKRISPFFIPSSLVNMLGGLVSINHNLKGPNLSSVTACAASTHALCEAAKSIMIGEAKAMLVVGAESAICPVGIGGFAAMKALSTRNDDPEHASRPFDKDRDGFVMGEGAGALVLEEYESALSRGAKIYAEIIGFGETGDAHHITSPSQDGPERAMKKALSMAENIKIDYVNAHGTSTYANDTNETNALKAIFGSNIPPVSSTKGQIGHCLGAAGAIEAVISIMALQNSIIPPTINQIEQDDECDLDYVPNIARKAELKTAMSNSFGFGGTNGSVIFKKLEK
ncbi:beta-ketoacyl-ACP synthase II [Campylobacter fetus]|uniref:3-oxoacyl-[acyl-carrier-protein] synthase 2 n=3 Tax=Campylobacter fetus TaxID=196 RepID=A0A5L4IFX6_CAMFE|nr:MULTISPECIES: beta-ketoacyl-ACP synthase II [Campylobacter]OCS22676.1 beta-ketoacyl-[acyl-carrier-protein] synthase II [Campylobacter fetus subsp. venerealis cfvi97/532]OCS26897.1 beta-ketoacyl-[acyl-carrier-protein] synthase II [Campylobacter fetus subsp. venerealis cfvB10]OCS30030.1 beta-ketoacyl-[acyl-carrier-protein] synthase II [Campylobacter fetus subsp. venerealis LMG 6570 = CCUG 33900]OCS42318.1 beta-ketoacyl-[acyl-carrier-protein] synthase II [Campylobacter fetus subsp. venerealis c